MDAYQGEDPSACAICGAEGHSCSPGMLGSGVRIVRLEDAKEEPMFTLAERTYVNRDSTKVVPEGSIDAAFLLGIEGDEISDETARRLGLVAAGEPDGGYAAKRIPDLREIAAARGIELGSELRKAEIIEALEGADATAATGGTADVGDPTEA